MTLVGNKELTFLFLILKNILFHGSSCQTVIQLLLHLHRKSLMRFFQTSMEVQLFLPLPLEMMGGAQLKFFQFRCCGLGSYSGVPFQPYLKYHVTQSTQNATLGERMPGWENSREKPVQFYERPFHFTFFFHTALLLRIL